MAKLLEIQASPPGARSASQAVAEHFINSYRTAHPGDVEPTLASRTSEESVASANRKATEVAAHF